MKRVIKLFTKNRRGGYAGFAIVTLLLIVAITFLCVPYNVSKALADDLRDRTAEKDLGVVLVDEGDNYIDDGEYEAKEILYEDEDRRTDSAKVFVQANGDLVLQDYLTDVHYFDGMKYLPIDNTLTKKTDANGKDVYVNESNSFRVSFSSASGNELVTVREGDVKITMNPIRSSETLLKISTYDAKGQMTARSAVNAGKIGAGDLLLRSNLEKSLDSVKFREDDLKKTISSDLLKLSGSLLFEDVLSGVDFMYSVEGRSLKENITIYSQATEYIYAFELFVENATPILTENGDIVFYDNDGNVAYTVPRGYMYDANGARSEAVEYLLDAYGSGYLLTVVADAEWINAEERAFPVVVDPTVIGVKTFTRGSGSYMITNNNEIRTLTNSFSSNKTNMILIGDTVIETRMAFLKLGESYSIPNKEVISASITANVSAYTKKYFIGIETSSSNVLDFSVGAQVFNFTNTPESVITGSTLYSLSNGSVNANKTVIRFDLSNYVKNYLDKAVRFTVPQDSGSYNRNVEFSSPIISITYKDTVGINSDDYNITQSLDTSGSGLINLNTGALSYVYNDITGMGDVTPISVSHIYSAGFGSGSGMGNDWKLNVNQSLVSNNGTYVYTDAVGKTYILTAVSNPATGRGTYTNKKLGLDLFFVSRTVNGTTETLRVLEDRNKNQLVFAQTGRLREIHNYPSLYNNPIPNYYLQIKHKTADLTKVYSVTGSTYSGVNGTLYFFYNADWQLTKTSFSSSQSGASDFYENFSYSADGNLVSITKVKKNALTSPESLFTQTTSFTYSAGKLISVANTSSTSTRYLEYVYNSAGKVSNYSFYKDATNKKTTTLEYTPFVARDDAAGVTNSVILKNGVNTEIVSFSNGVPLSDYSFAHNNRITISSNVSSGFDPFVFSQIYGETGTGSMNIVYDNFETTSGWQNSRSSTTYSVFNPGNTSLKCFKKDTSASAYKMITINAATDNIYYISLWVRKIEYTDAIIRVTAESADLNETREFVFDRNIKDEWQFGAIALEFNLRPTTIMVEIVSESLLYFDEFRVTKLPYMSKLGSDNATTYNAFGQVTKIYQDNPLDGTIHSIEYTYDTNNIDNSSDNYKKLTQVVEKDQNGSVIGKTLYAYYDSNNSNNPINYGKIKQVLYYG
ncbi:MAG: DUF6531 domain-containing protein, partial [Clostridiales bacterium]|nr:DUF6531 domain-containing protein [Clostridiales bacterium]